MTGIGKVAIVATIGLTVAATLVKAHDNVPKSNQRPGFVAVDTIDVDGDGKITHDEFVVYFNERFQLIDYDQNGQVTREEFKAHRTAITKAGASSGAEPGHPQAIKPAVDGVERQTHRARDPIGLGDVNGDGQLSRSEFSWVGNLMFSRLDNNNDGLLSSQDR